MAKMPLRQTDPTIKYNGSGVKDPKRKGCWNEEEMEETGTGRKNKDRGGPYDESSSSPNVVVIAVIRGFTD